MVFSSLLRLGRNNININNPLRSKGPDEFWRKRKIFKLAAHYFGRRRNCYSVAIKAVQRGLYHISRGRIDKKRDMKDLWELRVTSGCEEHGMQYELFKHGLARCNILLNKRILSDLAAWEPRTFKAIVDITKSKAIEEKLPGSEQFENPSHVITRDLLPK